MRFSKGAAGIFATITDLKHSEGMSQTSSLDSLIGCHLEHSSQLPMSPDNMHLAIHSDNIIAVVDFSGDSPHVCIIQAGPKAHKVLQDAARGKNRWYTLADPSDYRSFLHLMPEGSPVLSPDGNFLVTLHRHRFLKMWQVHDIG